MISRVTVLFVSFKFSSNRSLILAVFFCVKALASLFSSDHFRFSFTSYLRPRARHLATKRTLAISTSWVNFFSLCLAIRSLSQDAISGFSPTFFSCIK
jgi:hypothetical protein